MLVSTAPGQAGAVSGGGGNEYLLKETAVHVRKFPDPFLLGFPPHVGGLQLYLIPGTRYWAAAASQLYDAKFYRRWRWRRRPRTCQDQ